MAALATVRDEVVERNSLEREALRIQGVFCVAKEGDRKPLYKGLSHKIHWLGNLPAPQFVARP